MQLTKPGLRFPAWLWGPVLLMAAGAGMLRLMQPASPELLANKPDFRTLSLIVPSKSMLKLRVKREKALQKGVLITNPDDWVNAMLVEGEGNWPVKIRLKGDWPDHLRSGKWSFRVRMKDSGAWRGMSAFSLQHPGARDFLKEWLCHKILLKNKVLSPRYTFVKLKLNGVQLGVYALEEHFTKELAEAHGFREGPFFKFSETALWEMRAAEIATGQSLEDSTPFYAAGHPEAFQEKRWFENPDRMALYKRGLALMYAYKQRRLPPDAIFDLDAVARQYALLDLCRGHHSLVWHNRRFFYEPLSGKLLPVVFDAFSGEPGVSYVNGPFTFYATRAQTTFGMQEEGLGNIFLEDQHFVRAYYQYLHHYTDPKTLRKLLSDRDKADLKTSLDLLHQEFWLYRWERDYLERNAALIRDALSGLDAQYVELVRGVASGKGLVDFRVENYHPFAIEVYWMNRTPGRKQQRSEMEPLLLEAYDGQGQADTLHLMLGRQDTLFARVPGGPALPVFSR